MHPRALKDLRNLFDELFYSYEDAIENLSAAKEEIERLDELVSEVAENLKIADARVVELEAQVAELL